jgi:2-oxo-hept-3-ene-1,7-dioate hydratase
LIDARSHRIDPDDRVARGVRDTIADNAADAGVITGGRRMEPGAVDLRWVAAILKRNGVVEETGVAAAVLDDPAMGIVWLARRLAGYGITLAAGETILAGSFTRPVDCRAGDHFEVDYADLGVITVDFV